MGGVQGGGIRRFLKFANSRFSKSSAGVRQGENFRNVWGDQKKHFFDPKKSRNINFTKSCPKTYFKSLGPQLPFYDVFVDRFDSCSYW